MAASSCSSAAAAAAALRSFFSLANASSSSLQPRLDSPLAFRKPPLSLGRLTLPASASPPSIAAFSSHNSCAIISRGLSTLASLSSSNARRFPRVAALAADPFDLRQAEPLDLDSSPPDFEQQLIPPQGTKLYVGNLPWTVDSQQLVQVFQDIGSVEMVEVIYDRETGRSRGFAFVTMTTEQDANTAIERLDGVEYGGRTLRVNLSGRSKGSSSSSGPRYDSPYKVFVGNLPWNVDNVSLEQIFSEHGKVQEARVVYDRETGRSRGFGFVTLSTETEANEAITSLDGSDIDGRPIRVNLASDRPANRF